MSEYLVEVEHLKQYFQVRSGFKNMTLKAVDDVSFCIKPGETLGLVGESGCGKTTVGRSLLHLYDPTGGTVRFEGEEVTKKNIQRMRAKMQMVFQDPYSSLDPRMTAEDIIGEPIDVHHLCANRKERREKVISLMELVGLNSEHATRYAHEFSGGQRQRIGIARALAVDPKFIVCDEPVSALDVSIQAQVINMFEDLQNQLGVAYLFIAHDLLVVQHISNRIAVMYLGHVVELADANELMSDPKHPYTQSLLSAVPIPDPKTARKKNRIVLEGDVPSPLNMPSGCPFRTRCRYATEQCAMERPELTGRGGGLTDRGFETKKRVLRQALALHHPDPGNPVAVLAAVGGLDIAAMTGLFLGCAHEGLAAAVDGYISIVAALCAVRLCPRVRDVLFLSHASYEIGYRLAARELGLEPCLLLGMRLGEGSGCPLLFRVMQGACAVLNHMATFPEAAIEDGYLAPIRQGDAFTVDKS